MLCYKKTKNKLFHIKHQFLGNIENFFPKTYFSLIIGILFIENWTYFDFIIKSTKLPLSKLRGVKSIAGISILRLNKPFQW